MRRGTGHPLAPVGSLAARQGAAMAHRRRVMRGRKGLAALGLVLLSVVLAAAVQLSNEVTSLRRNIASLEARRLCAEAERALLLSEWNTVTALPVLTRRGREELGLEVTADPGLTLIAVRPAIGRQPGRITRFLGSLGEVDAAMAAEPPREPVKESMISLAPRRREPKVRP